MIMVPADMHKKAMNKYFLRIGEVLPAKVPKHQVFKEEDIKGQYYEVIPFGNFMTMDIVSNRTRFFLSKKGFVTRVSYG